MLRTALYILLGLAVVAAGIVGYASTKPDTFTISRSISIAAPPEAIFPLINDLRKMSEWSPFEKKDPDMKRSYSGPESGKGQRYDWDGNHEIGKGWLVITDSSAPSRVDMALNMERPISARNEVTFTLVPEGGTTKVTWAMQGAVPLVAKVVHLSLDVDRMVGGDFEAGLASLKAKAEGASGAPPQT
jgi:uncharacterized protein YndB with AHSA1/START domain